MDLERLKAALTAGVDDLADTLVDVSHRIHERPETCFEEGFAHDLLTSVLEERGVEVTRGAHGLDTAFVAGAGLEGPMVAICCEYDALPGLGHACGHNVIAAAGLGAGLVAAALAGEAGGRVRIVGAPAEEGGGGKVLLLRAGAFERTDAAMMVHPADADLLRMNVLAAAQVDVTYEGRPAHAAAFPHEGRNALDAAVLGYVNVAALRQHLRPGERVHGVFTRGGERPNIVPDHTEMDWMVRAARLDDLGPLRARVLACLEAGAQASGCRMIQRPPPPDYADMVEHPALLALYAANSARLGRPLADPAAPGTPAVVGSTDMGNLSYALPCIHPMIAVAPAGVSIHTPDFARHARSGAADRAILDGAKAMAHTLADVWAGAALA